MSNLTKKRNATPMILSPTEVAHLAVEQIPADKLHYMSNVHGYGRSVGPFPLTFFQNKFMKVKGKLPAIEVPDDMFNGVVEKPEKQMQNNLFRVLDEAGVFATFELRECSESIDPVSGIRLRPDLVLYALRSLSPLGLGWGDMEIFFEIKVEDLYDPHLLDAILQNAETMPENEQNKEARKHQQNGTNL
ncbi:hypothetical protein K474DRAFT_1676836 [Panus rudis PR-1116 ss-1]|nr:hypothetical protein K474DRAFT_1676836 [Panus rudis PR-1116 ss-1]